MLGSQAVDKARTSIDAMLAVHRLGAAGVDAPAWAHLVGNLEHVWQSLVTDRVRALRALVEARRMSLPQPKPLKRREPSARPLGTACTSHSVAPCRHPSWGPDAQLARLCIDYAADYHDDALRWSLIVVVLFLTDWLPRKVSLHEEEIELLPAVSRAWLRFVADERGFEDRLLGELLAAVDQFEGQFRDMIADSDNFGPAKSIAQLVEADAVDFSDPEAVQAWIDAFNARSIDERDGRIGGPFVN